MSRRPSVRIVIVLVGLVGSGPAFSRPNPPEHTPPLRSGAALQAPAPRQAESEATTRDRAGSFAPREALNEPPTWWGVDRGM